MRFQIGKVYKTYCWFTGGELQFIYQGEGKFLVIHNESDGCHESEEEHEIRQDENGEYILLYEYHGHEHLLYAWKEEPEMKHRQVIIGDYVITPIKNAFNNKYGYWISKKGYWYAIYCFTPMDAEDLDFHLREDVVKNYIDTFDNILKH